MSFYGNERKGLDSKAAPTRTGPLNRDTSLDNSEAFGTTTTRGNRALNGAIEGVNSLQNEALDRPGFDADAKWLIKKGTPYGEMALFNQLPPGMDIDDQNYIDINTMPFKTVIELGYPGDGAFPVRDIPE